MVLKENKLFINDYYLPGMLNAKTVRAEIARGDILRIDLPEDENGITIINSGNISGRNELHFFENKMPVFADKKINYRGEPLFLVLSEKDELIEEYMDKINIEYNNLPEYSFEKDLMFDEQIVYQKIFSYPDSRSSKIPENSLIVEDNFFANEYHSRYCEPYGAVAYVDENSCIVIHTVSQWPNHVKKTVSDVLGINQKKVIVKISALSSPIEGRIWYPSMIAAQAAAAAVQTGRPVKLLLNRYETFHYAPRQFPFRINYKSAIINENIYKTEIKVEIDAGSYPLIIEDIIEKIPLQVLGAYGISRADINLKIITTSKPPMSFMSAFNYNQIQISLEKHISQICRFIKKSPAEWRKTILFSNSRLNPLYYDIFNQTEKSIILNKKSAESVIDGVIKLSDFERKYSAYELLIINSNNSKKPVKSHGIGIALNFYHNDIPVKTMGKEKITIRLFLDNKSRLTIYTSTVPDGINNYALWKKTASAVLGINQDDISISPHQTQISGSSSPYPFCKGLAGFEEALKKSCLKLQKRRFREPLPIEIESSINLENLRQGDISWGAAAVEVIIDNYTYEIEIKGVWCSYDCGNIIFDNVIDKTVYSGIIDSLNWISGAESLSRNKNRVFMNDNLWHYFNIPIISEYLNKTKSSRMLALGDLPLLLIPSAYYSAISQALGVDIERMPLTLEELYNIIKNNGN